MNQERLRKSPNIAIVGSTSLLGKELQDVLEAHDFPMRRRVLLETEEYAGLLQEFAGEIQITQVISPSAFDDIDIAFFTCSPEIMRAYVASGARFPDLTIDLTQSGPGGTVYLDGVSSPRLLRAQGYFTNPHPATIVIGRVLSRLHGKYGLKSAAVTILEPASERGNAGVDELQEQTVNLLNFQPVPAKVFEGQLAFNILPEQQTAEQTEKRIIDQLRQILDHSVPMPIISSVQVPVFHSHVYSMFVYLAASPSLTDIAAYLDRAPENPSPVGVVGTDNIHIGRINLVEDQPGAYSVWLFADNLRLAASNAIQIAEYILCAPALEM